MEDYGLSVSPAQGDQILRELLSLCLFWAWSALDAGLADKNRDRVWATLVQRRNKPEAFDVFSTGITFNPEPAYNTGMACGWPGWGWCGL